MQTTGAAVMAGGQDYVRRSSWLSADDLAFDDFIIIRLRGPVITRSRVVMVAHVTFQG
jgi:hypothetical protein